MSNGTNRSGRGGGGGGGGGTANAQFQILQQQPNIQPTQQMAQQANQRQFNDTDTRPYHQLLGGRNYFQSQNLTIDQQLATVNYLSDTPESGSLYNMAQNMNYALATGQPLNANQDYVYNHLMSSMHNLGENVTLTRYDHETFVNSLLKQNGVNTTYDKMSLNQLKQALVGTTYGENKLVSTSTNDFANAPQSSKQTFMTRAVKLSYNASANTQAMMPGNGPGGALGEMVLARTLGNGQTVNGRNNTYTITDVKFTGNSARRQGTQSFNLNQIELVVDVHG